MNSQAAPSSVTFKVQDVKPATGPLTTCKTHEALRTLLGTPEACFDYTTDCVQGIRLHSLYAATHLAFSEHRPLVLSPDMIWVTILQGLALHVRNNAETLRDRLVSHQGKVTITVVSETIIPGSPENAWDEVIRDFSQEVRQHVGPVYDRLLADFSTTGPLERTACEVALLDTYQPYFELVIRCVCGIPEITLEGTAEDWTKLRDKLEVLQTFDLEWWVKELRPIADQLVRASQGDVDLSFWKDIYKQEQAYGTELINGWLVKLTPYVKNFSTGNYTHRNPLLEKKDARISTDALPSGFSQVPFRLQSSRGESQMEMLGGFLGITQDPESLALRPRLGWAIRQSSPLGQLLGRLAPHAPTPPLSPTDFDRHIQGRRGERPGDFFHFYKTCNGVTLKDPSGQKTFCFLPLEKLEYLEDTKEISPSPSASAAEVWNLGGPWLRFCSLADGTFLALALQYSCAGWKIARVRPGEALVSSPVVAMSLTELLEKILDNDCRLDALDPPDTSTEGRHS